MSFQKKVQMTMETAAGPASVVDYIEDGEAIRYLMVGKTIQSGAYLDPERSYDLLFPYLDHISWMLAANPEIRDVYMIGGGAGCFARHFIHNFFYKNIDVAESDPAMIAIGEQYFHLRETEEEGEERLQIRIGDGFELLRNSTKKYDVIINDAFTKGRSIGRNRRDTETVKEHLKDGGVYITNVTSALSGEDASSARHYRDMLARYFQYIQLIQAEDDRDPRERQNILAYASDEALQ